MSDHLSTYLSDHLGGAEAGVALLERWRGHLTDPAIAQALEHLHADIVKDRQSLEDLYLRVTGERATVKRTVGWFAEKIAGLKHLGEYDDFALFESLEILSLGILGKRALWSVLNEVSAFDQRLAGMEFGILEHRATSQFAQVEELRRQFGTMALRVSSQPHDNGR